MSKRHKKARRANVVMLPAVIQPVKQERPFWLILVSLALALPFFFVPKA